MNKPRYPHVDRSKPLMVVVDTSVFIHKLHQSILMERDDPQYESVLKANLVWLMSGAWLGEELRPLLSSMVFVQDKKDRDLAYWRTHWLKDLRNTVGIPRKARSKKATQALTDLATTAQTLLEKGVETEAERDTLVEAHQKLTVAYKAGRSLPDYSFKKTRNEVYKWLEELDAFTLYSTGFEADDMAASIVQVNVDNGSPWNVMLLTVDSDWMGLINPNVTWCCMSGFAPTVRDSIEVCNQWAVRRLKSELTTWRDIWDIKGQKGDSSDNLPPSGGLLMPVIDLLNPPAEYQYWLRARAKIEKLFTSQPSKFGLKAARAAGKHLRANGMAPVVRMLPGEVSPLVETEQYLFDLTDVEIDPPLQTVRNLEEVKV